MTYPAIKYQETFYKNVAATTEDQSTGITPAIGEHIAVYRFRANGSDPSAYVALVWDRGGSEEKVIASTKGDIDIVLAVSHGELHFTGDGSKKLNICIVNDQDTITPIIGGAVEVLGVD